MRAGIGVGLIGCGQMGLRVAEGVVEANPSIRMRAAFDPSPVSRVAASAAFGPELDHEASLQALLARDDIDWVMIASWNRFHADQAVAAFAAGKHVFCQKPLALGLDDCLRMREAWRASGREFVIGFNLRYAPHYRAIRAVIDGGTLGQLVSMEFSETLDFNHGGFIFGDWRRHTADAGSQILEKCCHDIDLANWFTGSRAARVASFGGRDVFTPAHAGAMDRVGVTRSGRQGYMTWERPGQLAPFTDDTDLVDNQVAILEYENGVRASFHFNAQAGIPERRMLLLGTEGALRADLYSGRIEVKRVGFGTPIEEHGAGSVAEHGGGDEVLAEALAATMSAHAPTLTSLDDGLAAAVTCFAIDAALASGEVVSLAPLWARVDS